MNLYSYVTNNPVNWIDPWGLQKKLEKNAKRYGFPNQFVWYVIGGVGGVLIVVGFAVSSPAVIIGGGVLAGASALGYAKDSIDVIDEGKETAEEIYDEHMKDYYDQLDELFEELDETLENQGCPVNK